MHKGFIGDEGCRVQVNVTVAVKSEDEGGEEAGDVWVGAVLVRCRIRFVESSYVDRGERGYLLPAASCM